MQNIAKILKNKRTEFKYKLKEVSTILNIDMAIVSKLERGERKVTKKQILAFIDFYALNKKEILITWLSEKIYEEIKDEKYNLDALYLAEEKLKTLSMTKDKPLLNPEIIALLTKIDFYKEKLRKKSLVEGDDFLEYKEKNYLKYTYQSNRIHGNSLSLEETELVVLEGQTIVGKSMHEHLEAINHYDTIEFIKEVIEFKKPFTEKLIKEIHYSILKGIDRKNAGKYRKTDTIIKGSKFKPPQADLIDKKIENVVSFYNNNKESIHPVILAAEIHEKIYSTQAFLTGNGRLARFIMNYILLKNGYQFIIIKGIPKNKKFYHKALEKIQLKNETKDFHLLICNLVLELYEEFLEKIL